MLNTVELDQCRNDFRVVAYRHGHVIINAAYGDDVRAAWDEFVRLQDADFTKIALFNFNEPILVQ